VTSDPLIAFLLVRWKPRGASGEFRNATSRLGRTAKQTASLRSWPFVFPGG